MTAVITAPIDITTEPLAPLAGMPAPGRAQRGDFDLLIGLLQAALTPPPMIVPGMPAPARAGAASAVGLLVSEPAVTTDKPAASPGAGATLPLPLGREPLVAPQDDATIAIGASVEGLDPGVEDDAGDASPAAASAAVLVAFAPVPVLVAPSMPEPSTVLNVVPEGAERPVDVPHATPAVAAATSRTLDVRRDVTSNVQALHAPQPDVDPTVRPSTGEPAAAAPAAAAAAKTPTVAPPAPPDLTTQTDVQSAVATAAAPEGRPRPVVLARDVEPGRARDGAAAPERTTGDGAQRLTVDGAPRVVHLATGRDELSKPDARGSRDGEAVAPASETGASGASTPTPSSAGRVGLEDVERSRPDAVRLDPVDQVTTRLREIRTPGRHEISVRLDPPDLGAVRIDARLEGARLTVQIRAEHAPTSEMLTEALPRIREALAQQGFTPGDVSVHLGLDGSGRNAARDNAPAFTPPRDGEPSPHPRVVPAAARAVAVTDGLDVWA